LKSERSQRLDWAWKAGTSPAKTARRRNKTRSRFILVQLELAQPMFPQAAV